MSEIQAERLVGRRVRDAAGHSVGRLAEIIASREGDEIVVTAYLVGHAGWLHRFAVHGLGLRVGPFGKVYRVRWDQMQLDDPSHPVTTCAKEDLARETLPPRKRGLQRRPGRRLG